MLDRPAPSKVQNQTERALPEDDDRTKSMKKLGTVLVAIVLVALSAIILWLAVRGLAHLFKHTSANDKPATITALGLIVVAVITYLFNRGADRRRVLEELTRKEKITLYETIVNYLMRLLVQGANVTAPDEQETQDFIASTTPKLITYGANPVVKLWGHFIRSSPSFVEADPWDVMLVIEQLLKAIRKDVGHRSITLADGDLARLFLTDVDETIAARKLHKRSARNQP